MSDSEYNSFPQARGFTYVCAALQQVACVVYRMAEDRIVAVGLLTQRELTLLGATFDRLWPVEEAPQFEELLDAIDRADEELQHKPVMPSQG